ncbi:hypothetical protein GCM10011351_28520 [Paraliobacillus quinghaiensis]|uniref:Uncharacterized protein n=1 Tax=Paraliobacillus quinghaiensis TaxID=470815 RepID=A0A917TVY5_9BACI|nr:DUF6544 family protein [Paraliobacillus quinghaiensis]GGM40614.1 hypothetical protein GCM10011351_28520 [Paraliobacillus quinghaiensis]
MKGIFLFLIFIHGLIHLMGFLKAFRMAELNQLTIQISKPIGLLWLITAILFLLALFSILLNQDWWWMPGLLAIIISQFLIFLTWQDAKFGTIANVIILAGVLIGYGGWSFNLQTNNDFQMLQSKVNRVDNKQVITEEMVEVVPLPVQKWLKNVGVVGKEKINTVSLKQKGLMKLKPSQEKWTTAEAEQYITVEEPGFIWNVNMRVNPFMHVVGRDLYIDGKSDMTIKLASLISVANVSDNWKANESTLQRYLLEMPWYPSAALSSYITWKSIDQYSAKATMTHQGVTGSATFYFKENGDLEKITALRFKDTDENAERLECIGEIIEQTVVDGITIPIKLNVSWMLEEGKYTWYKIDVFDVKFN